jgi:hypothetical protein
MTEKEPTNGSHRKQRLAAAAGLLLAGGLAGGILAATNGASAADTAGSAGTTSAATGTSPRDDSATSVRPGEKLLTGTNADKARAAALKAVPGGTIVRLETDADGATYEAHMNKADGTRVTVKLDKNFAVTATDNGMGGGGPGGHSDRSGANADGTGV